MSETPDTNGEKSQIDIIEELLMEMEFIQRVSFKSEGPIEMSPNVLTITPEYGVSERRLKLLGRTVTKLIQAIHPQYEIKGRLTHELTDKTNENGDMIGFKPILHLPRIKILWFGRRWDRTPDKTRFDTDTAFEVPSDETIENQEEFIEKIAVIEAASFDTNEDNEQQPAFEVPNNTPETTNDDIIDV